MKFRIQDIYKDVILIRNLKIIGDEIGLDDFNFYYVIVLSQTCYLERIYDKDVNSVLLILVAPLFELEKFKDGTYLNFVGIHTEEIKKDRSLKPYISREKPRYYVLNLNDELRTINSLSDSFIVDFKYFFTVDISQFSKDKYISRVKPFYREKLSHNFAFYLSRIGIPNGI